MFSQIPILISVFGCVTAFCIGIAMLTSGRSTSTVEGRLQMLTSAGKSAGRKINSNGPSLLSRPLDEGGRFADLAVWRFGNVQAFLDQAGLQLKPDRFFLMSVGVGLVGLFACVFADLPVWLTPAGAVAGAATPFAVIWIKRRRRMSAFAKQLPDALELISRALRAGHSLGSGFQLVGGEMPAPIGFEFQRCYEEQNLGISLEQSLDGMTTRVPNLDLRFFATAVILQRQTGGDLAEILDKIGMLIRDRFKVWGQIQALTGEGRLSGVVLLALPPVLFLAMRQQNPDYCRILFTDPMGQKMLWGAIFLQFVGAIVIRKIINIQV